MDREQALATFTAAIADLLGVAPGQLGLDQSWDDYEVDSLGLTEIALVLTDTFGVDLPDVEPEDFRTIGQAFALVTDALGLPQPP